MASKKFEDLLRDNIKNGHTVSRAKGSLQWFKDNLVKISSTPSANRIIEGDSATSIRSWTNLGLGSMYFVHYNPKHKDKLKYYDNFPLIIPIEKYDDGILGLNLHYIAPVLRAKLLDALMETVNDKTLDDNAKMKIRYAMLASVAKNKYYKACIKRYLGKHFTSQFIKIHPSAWEPSLYLPVESFQKATKQQVWNDSRKMR